MRFLLAVLCLASAIALAQPAFEFNNGDPVSWDILDFDGDGLITTQSAENAPPPYGPAALQVAGNNLLLLAKDLRMAKGTLALLYRELDPVDRDADGIVVFAAAYPDDVEEVHNTKERLPYAWLEQDNDSGLHFRQYRGLDDEVVLAQENNLGNVTEAWNITNWIWQKVQMDGGRVRAKYWAAQEPEPEAWNLEAPWTEDTAQRVGIRIGSGAIQVAYFAADAEDIAVTPPAAWLFAPRIVVPGPANLDLKLYVNDPPKEAARLTAGVFRGDTKVFTFSGERTLLGNPAYMNVTRWCEREEGRPLLTAEAEPGDYSVVVKSDDGRIDAQATFALAPTAELRTRIDVAEAAAREVGAEERPYIQGLRDSVTALAEEAHTALDAQGDVEAAERSMRYALQPLRHLASQGLAAWPGALEDLRQPDPITPAGEQGRSDFFRTGMALRVAHVNLHGAGALVAGQTYPVTLTLEGLDTVAAPLTCTVLLRSPLGTRTVASSTVDIAPDAPTRQTLEFTLTLPKPEDAALQPQPNILSEPHDLLLSVRHKETGANVLLDMPPGHQPDRPGQHTLLDTLYVSTEWPELGAITPGAARIGEPVTFRAEIRDDGPPMQLDAVLTITTPGGELVHREVQWFLIIPQQIVVLPFAWTPDTAGELKRSLEIFEFGRLHTRIDDTLHVAPPEGVTVDVRREATESDERGEFVTPVVVEATGATARSLFVKAGATTAGEGGSQAFCTPHYGYYDVTAHFGDWRHAERLVAQCVDVRDGVLCLNGEPLIIKGLNVHGMDGASPERTRTMMRIFRNLGFNALRGDYPPAWQMDMALEENLSYTVLAPFSCCDTDEIKARQDGPFITTAQELTRLFIERYKDEAGVLFWNSCNEVTGDITSFLSALYPLYQMDPAQRPVHYANLFGQDRWQGQDFMSVNYYFSAQEGPEARHPNIARSLEIAKEHHLPLTYTEFNSWHGAVIPSGVDALEGMFTWGNDRGMQGGYYYFRFDSERHPGIIDNAYNTHYRLNDALHEAFADAEVEVIEAESTGARLVVRNRRDFTLRDMTLTLTPGDGTTYESSFAQLAPGESKEVDIVFDREMPGNGLLLEGTLTFTTHYAFHERVAFRLPG